MKATIIDSGVYDCDECRGRGFDYDSEGRFTCPFCKGAGELYGEPVEREVEYTPELPGEPFTMVWR